MQKVHTIGVFDNNWKSHMTEKKIWRKANMWGSSVMDSYRGLILKRTFPWSISIINKAKCVLGTNSLHIVFIFSIMYWSLGKTNINVLSILCVSYKITNSLCWLSWSQPSSSCQLWNNESIWPHSIQVKQDTLDSNSKESFFPLNENHGLLSLNVLTYLFF